ncbi:unnamed protein product [Arabidopsis halleri]
MLTTFKGEILGFQKRVSINHVQNLCIQRHKYTVGIKIQVFEETDVRFKVPTKRI